MVVDSRCDAMSQVESQKTQQRDIHCASCGVVTHKTLWCPLVSRERRVAGDCILDYVGGFQV